MSGHSAAVPSKPRLISWRNRVEPRRAAPFSATRSRLAATFSSRLLSVRPEAASGGRPSSVIALRTAAQ